MGAAIFAASLTALYGVSAAYHRGQWSARALKVMRRLDHCMIFVLIAGSYTPVVLLALAVVGHHPAGGVVGGRRARRGDHRAAAGAVAGGRLHHVPHPGVAGDRGRAQLAQSLSAVELGLLATGGLLYTVGAVVLASGRPDPRLATFGYHEIRTRSSSAPARPTSLVTLLVRP